MLLRVLNNPGGYEVQWSDGSRWNTVSVHNTQEAAERFATALDTRSLSATESERVVWTSG